MKSKFIIIVALCSLVSCKSVKKVNVNKPTDTCQSTVDFTKSVAIEDGAFTAKKSKTPVVIDGCDQDAIWSQVDWHDMNYLWMGDAVNATDYNGAFKLAWDREFLYILVAVTDDVLHPTLKDGIENYWKGDYVEVFIDKNRSGGDHKFNHQAFAYHISTEGHAIDKNTQEKTVFFDDHVTVKRSQNGNTYLWEMAVKLYDDSFNENSNTNLPMVLKAGKTIGFSIAYGDNDGRGSRENFMGSKKQHGVNNDEGYVNADVFGSVLFVEE